MCFFTLLGRMLLLAVALIMGMHTVYAQQQPWTGDGGKGISLAVFEPAGKGLSTDEQWMLDLVHRTIAADFDKFSDMTVINPKDVEKVLEQWKEIMSGNYSDATLVKIGNLISANHILTGSISKTKSAFMLELSVTDLASGERKASYAPTPITEMALENLSVIKAASAELLRQLGVNLTSAGQSELMQVVNMTQVRAQEMYSRGMAAQRQGTDVAALSYFFQAEAFDPSLFDVSKRSSIIAANISSGNIGADVRNDILWRKSWVARLSEAEVTFHSIISSADPPYRLYYSTDIKTGNIDYQTETADLSITINMTPNRTWFKAMRQSLKAVQAVLNGLNTTNRKNDWGLSGWPSRGVTETNPFASPKRYEFTVVFELVNQQGRVIGSQTVRLNPEFGISANNITFTNIPGMVKFNGVRANDISDNMTIRVVSVNGAPPQNARFTIAVNKSQPLVDTRDGKRYKTITTGDFRTWMAENLNYQPQTGNSWCYGNDNSYCTQYGRLYDWNTAMKVCPAGWHLPDIDEWNDLIINTNGGGNAGKKLKAKNGWNGNGNGTDDYDFSALPGGGRYFGGNFASIGYGSRWWTATVRGSGNAYSQNIDFGKNNVSEDYSDKSYAFSVRCVAD
jgi:uncharacterized protein (TIGR02145 family)